jgi:hypothetical protein
MTAPLFAAVTLLGIPGWLVGARIALTARLNRLICPEGTDEAYCPSVHRHLHDLVPAGQLYPRTLTDACVSLAVGFAWPVLIVAWLLNRTTPATPGETARLLAEQRDRLEQQEADIHALTRRITTLSEDPR